MSQYMVCEDEIIIDGDKYTELINEDGSVSLRRFNEETKMWVTLNFAKEDNSVKLQQLHEICKDVFIQ